MASQHIDLLTRLPFELTLEIFGYLPLLSAWKLQLVSKQWRTLLTTPKFLAPRLAQDGRLLASFDAEDSTSTIEEQVQRSTRSMQAMRLGRPFSYSELHVKLQKTSKQVGPETSLLHAEALCGKNFAYTTLVDGGSNVVLYDLTSGQEQRYQGLDCEHILAITLTNRVLSFVTLGGMLCVADLRAREKPAVAIRLPSSKLVALKSDCQTIALRFYPDTLATYIHSSKRLDLYRLPEQNMTVPALQGTLVLPGDILISEAQRHRTEGLYRIRLDVQTDAWYLEYTDGTPHSSVMFDAKAGHIVRWRDTIYCFHRYQDERLTVFTAQHPGTDAAEASMEFAHNRNTLGRRVAALHQNGSEGAIAAFVNGSCIVTLGYYWDPERTLRQSGRISVFWFDEASTLAGGYDTGLWTAGDEARFPWTLDLDRQYVIPKARGGDGVAV
ncbi:hypothetical protein LTR97_010656 [Elasticomyces elasticus]|uniref:F-box domain-containing protein n=1 Tax=Elasticomyces elasticus TaxID=574655 RepID=A0AAN7VLU0_9PEZI|nr:hypothetical protein LTR97_010656 [Elasticomyces elasticus]